MNPSPNRRSRSVQQRGGTTNHLPKEFIMKRSTRIIASAVALGALTVAGVSLAHPPGYGPGSGYGMGYGMGPGAGPGMGWGMGPGGGWMAGTDGGALVAGRLTALKSELKITADQEAAWSAFAEQAQQQVAAMQALRDQMHSQMLNGQAGPGGQDFAATRDAMFKLRQAGAEARAAQLKNLYAVLTPEQKTLADRQLFGGYGPGRGYCGGQF
jgi:Spy/CpxP family protein refolding chaperone